MTQLENEMDAAGDALANLCQTIEEIDSNYHCCAASANAQMHCGTKTVLDALNSGIDTSAATQGTCDTGTHSSSDLFCKPDGEFWT